MKPIFFLFTVFITCGAFAQLKLGVVKADSNYNHYNIMKRDFPDLKDLYDSKNELEIRVCYMCPRPFYENLIIFTYNDSVWNVQKYETIYQGSVHRKTSTKYDIDRYDPWYSALLFGMLDTLKQNNAFGLVSQNKLDNVQGHIFDGAGYLFSFRYKNTIGGYRCNSPAFYADANPDIKELREYANIENLILNTFKHFEAPFYHFDQ